jgi:hypothetical protein
MAEILVKAHDSTHIDPMKDSRACFKRGHPVVVMPDGHQWGTEERLPKFVVLKVPGVPVDRMKKYVSEWTAPQTGDVSPELAGVPDSRAVTLRRRRWRLRWADLPLLARTKLQTVGELTIKASSDYLGPFDYTWDQAKTFFRNDESGLDETMDV